MKIGIIQGRLTPPSEGHQTTPRDWKKEFDQLEDYGLVHIEWNLDENKLLYNPIFKEEIGKKTLSLISSVCFDNLVTEEVYDSEFFRKNFTVFLSKLERVGVYNVTIPLLEKSGINSDVKLEKIKSFLTPIVEKHKRMKFNIESDSDPENVRDLLSISNRMYFTYDTGNITAANYDHEKYINKVFDKIRNVHLKDRKKSGGQSVLDFKGDTDFEKIFRLLSKRNYNELFTLQMARGVSGQEGSLIKDYLNFFRKEYGKHF